MSGSSRKRARLADDSAEDNEDRSLRPFESIYHVQSELADVKAALEHEQSLRSIDQRRFQQEKTRLERQIEFALEEAQENKAMLEELREESDLHIAQLRQGRTDALLQLRQVQARLAQAEVEAARALGANLDEENQWLLQQQLQHKDDEIDELRERLAQVTEEGLASLADKQETTPKKAELPEGASSPAPKEVLKELNRVRIQLAESERKYRQLHRKSDEWQQKAHEYVQEREANRTATLRLTQMEHEVRDLRKEHEALRASNASWDDFAHKLSSVVLMDDSARKKNGPPEIATVLRHLEKSKLATKHLEEEKSKLSSLLSASKEQMATLELKVKEDATTLSKCNTEKTQLESQLEAAQQQLQTMRAQEGIWRREADSLRTLVKTFDSLPTAKSSSGGATEKSLEISLQTARDEVKVLMEDRDRLNKDVESLQETQKEQQKEHDRVVEKFGKLREALQAEKAKVKDAEDRACQAEALAGKGSFNEKETRVLHLERNPLTDAIRDRYETEIRSLQRQLEEATGQKPSARVSQGEAGVDPQKLHQRLKQSFKEQIALFREGVYLMTGYKVDMLPKGEKPMFRVRSVYAEHEQDHLMFVCQKSGEEVTSLDLVETDFAKLLSTTDSYQYMTKFNSLPGFLASVQLSLFEKQTFIAS